MSRGSVRVLVTGIVFAMTLALQTLVAGSAGAATALPARTAVQPTQFRPDIDAVRRLASTGTARSFPTPQWVTLEAPHGRTRCTILGTPGPDVIVGTPGPDRICSLGGGDIVYGLGGDDHIYGGPGDDEIHGDDGKDEVFGDGGNDVVYGNAGDDRLMGDANSWNASPLGADVIYAGAGSDYVSGGPGPDLINTGSNDIKRLGQDIADGDGGDDVIVGGLVAWTNTYFGGDGNDILFPSPVRVSPLGNGVIGGKGDDIAILVNGMQDGFTAGNPLDSVKVPIVAGCTATVAVADRSKGHSVSCSIGGRSGKVAISAGTNGEAKVSGSFLDGLGKLSLTNLNGQTRGKLGGDFCACDPKISLQLPGDHQS